MMGVAAFTGCKKSSSSDSPYSMKATVGSTAFSTTHCLAVSNGAGGLIITGWSGTATAAVPPQINIAITSWNGGTGTTTFDSTLATGYEEYLPNTTTVSESVTGSVTITSVSAGTISGNFSFTGNDGTVVSGGTFTGNRN